MGHPSLATRILYDIRHLVGRAEVLYRTSLGGEVLLYLCLYLLALLSVRQALFSSGFSYNVAALTGYSAATAQQNLSALRFTLYQGYNDSATSIFNLFFDWPAWLTNNVVLLGEVMLFLIVTVYFVLVVLVGRLTYQTVSGTRVVPLTFAAPFVLFMLLNPVTLVDLGSGLYPFLIATPIVLYILVKLARLATGSDRTLRDYLKIGLALSFASLGDPRYFVWIWLAVILFLLTALVRPARFLRLLKPVAVVLLVSLPALLFTYFTETFGHGTAIYTSFRPLSWPYLQYFSSITSYTHVFSLLGTWWPTPVLGPPSIAGSSSLGSLPVVGFPPILVLPTTPDTPIWLFTLFIPSILAVSSLLFARRRPEILLFWPGLLFFFAVTLGTNFPFAWFVDAYIALGSTPVIGGIWSITFAVPDFFNQMILPFFALFIGVLIAELIRAPPTLSALPKQLRRLFSLTRALDASSARVVPRRWYRRRPGGPVVFACLIAGSLLLSGWQFIPGDLGPGGWANAPTPNGLTSPGRYSPYLPPASWLDEYRTLAGGDNGSYAIAWTPATFYNWTRSQVSWTNPTVYPDSGFYTAFSQLAQDNQAWLVKTLMDEYGVRYFVVDNTTLDTSNSQFIGFLDQCPGVDLTFEVPNSVYVYSDPNASIFGPSETTVFGLNTTTSPVSQSGYLALLFNQTPLLTLNGRAAPAVTPVSWNATTESAAGTSIMTAPGLGRPTVLPGLVDSLVTGFQPNSATNYPVGNGWVLTNFAGNGSLTGISNGTLTIQSVNATASHQMIFTFDYLSVLTPGKTAIILPDYNNTTVTASWTFQYRTVGRFQWLENSIFGQQYSLQPESNWTTVRLNSTIPSGVHTFTFQVAAQFNGTVEIRGVNARYTTQAEHYGLPFTAPDQLGTLPLRLRQGDSQVNAYLLGQGYIVLGNATIANVSSLAVPQLLTIHANVSSPDGALVEFFNLSVAALAFGPQPTMDQLSNSRLGLQFAGFRAWTGRLALKGTVGGFIALPDYGWQPTNAYEYGPAPFGRTIYYLIPNEQHSFLIPNELAGNIVTVGFAVGFYAAIFAAFALPSVATLVAWRKLPIRGAPRP